MSKIRQKSEFNIDAAERLLKDAYYAPSVHCSYYSCFQLLKFTIKDFFEVDYDMQAVKISTTGQKTHQYVVNYVASELKKLAGFEESQKFKRTIKDLKQFRIESDYENLEIDSIKGNDAFKKAQEIRSYVIKNFPRMKSKQYLLDKLQELSLNFKDIKIRYEHRLNTSSHLIEVVPLAIFQSNEEYMLAEANLEDEFENLFPQEDIVFVSEDSLTEIKRPDLLLGYESVTFENESSNAELIFEGYSLDVDYAGCEYYALAA